MPADVREKMRAASRARWDREDYVDARVAILAEHVARKVATFPPLNAEQRAVLRDALSPVLDT